VTVPSPVSTRTEPRHIAVLVSLFLLLTITAGCTNYNLPLYLQHLTKDRGLSLSGVSFGTTVFFISGALIALPTGRLLTRVQPRLIMLVGGLAGAAALVALGQSRQLWQAYLCYGVMGAAFSAGGALPASTAVLRISTRTQRARMLATSTVGVSAGGFIVTPISTVLLGHVGLGPGLLILGCVWAALTIGVITLLMPAVPMPTRTAAMTADAPVPVLVEPELGVRAALHTRTFWLIATCFILYFSAQIGSTNHIIRMASDRGLGHLGLILPVVTLSAVLGRLLTSMALQRASIWAVLTSVLVIIDVATVCLSFANSLGLLLIGGALLGLTIGQMPIVQPIALAEAFGVHDYPRIASVMTVFSSLGLGGGPVLVSFVHNSTTGTWGLYRAGYLALTATSTVGCALAVVIAVRFARGVPVIADR
jgi:MFS family permease